MIKKLGLLLLGLGLGLLVLEGSLRLLGWAFLQSRQITATDSAASGHYKILCLGESTTADMSVLGQDSYPAQLERILNQRSTGTKFTVINGGLPAVNTDVILAELSANLERHKPNMVVAMIGINDRGADLALPGSGGLRVWKLVRMLTATVLREEEHGRGDTLRNRDTEPTVLRMTRKRLWADAHIAEKRYAQAEELLLSVLDESSGIQRTRALGQLAVLNWQRGTDDDGAYYHEAFESWHFEHQDSKTVANYRALERTLEQRGVFLMAVQYPGRSVEPLRRLVKTGRRVGIVDNQAAFLDAVQTRPVTETYRDLFGGIFGHMTPYGNSLLAENIAAKVLEVVE